MPSPLDRFFRLLWDRDPRLPNLPAMEDYARQQGYPDCCITAFSYDLAHDRYPGMLRGLDPTGSYVPCPICASIHGGRNA